jgi:sec-independent protein translocase protein TatB
MFDLSMSELLVVGVVALIVIGPKDLPELFRSLGRVTAKMRGMAREFSRAMEAAADEAGVKDVAKDLKSMTSAKSMGLDAVKEAATKFEKWDPLKNAARPSVPSTPRAEAKPVQAMPDLLPDPAAMPPAAVPEPKPVPEAMVGPTTQALAEKQAARKAVALEAAEKLKRPVAEKPKVTKPKAEAEPKPKAAPKPKAEPAAMADAAAKKPRAPRKAKSTDTPPKADT